MAWTDNLGNGQIKALAIQAVADNVVNYQEMFTILDTAASAGISATDYDDLRAVYTNSTALFASDYVKSISYSARAAGAPHEMGRGKRHRGGDGAVGRGCGRTPKCADWDQECRNPDRRTRLIRRCENGAR